MKFFKSRTKHNPPHSYGDCFAACLSTLVGTKAPHVLHDGCDHGEAMTRLNRWLQPRGLAYVEYPLAVPSVMDALAMAHYLTRYSGIHYMLMGLNEKGNGHWVVGLGDKIDHNPTQGSEIINPHDDGVFWIGLVVNRV